MYSNEMSFGEWVNQVSSKANAMISTVQAANMLYLKWYKMTYGLSPAQIAELPQFEGKTEADITALGYALGALSEVNTALSGNAVGASDRIGYMTPIL